MKPNQILLFTSFIIVSLSCSSQHSEEALLTRASRLHGKILTLDSHADTPLQFMRPGFSFGQRQDSMRRSSKIDLPRLEEGQLDGIFFAAFVGQSERSETGNEMARDEARMICDSIHAIIQRYPTSIELATQASDLKRISRKGKHAIYIGMENGYPIGNDLALIDTFYNLGVRYITLCHSKNNDICDSSTDNPEHGGLSEFGEGVLRRMNQKGIMVDLSHASDSAFYDVIKLSKVPVIASHSGARALCDHPRNLSDDMLVALKENGGVVQVCLVSEYVKTPLPYPQRDSAKNAVVEKHGNYYELDQEGRQAFIVDWYAVDREFPPRLATVSDFVDHIDHIVELAGIDHVGIGSDFDGGGALQDCYDVSQIQNITTELLRRDYTAEDIANIWSGNLIRVFSEVETFAKQNAPPG